MEINNSLQQSTSSIRQALGIATLKKSLHQDAQSLDALLQGLQAASTKTMESSVTPYKGGNIDVRV